MLLRSIILVAFLTVSLSVKGQFHITPQVGYTFSSLMQYEKNHNRYVSSQMYDKIKPTFGISASKQISTNLRLQTDFFYSQRGVNVEGSFLNHYWLLDVNTEHLDIGLQLGYMKFENIAFEAGLYYSHILDTDVDEWSSFFIGPPVPFTESNVSIVGHSEFYDNETGASLGLSYTLFNIIARAKYSFGIWGTREGEKHHWFLLTLGYRFEV